MRAAGGDAGAFLLMSQTRPRSHSASAGQIQERHGGVDVLINCAGARVQQALVDISVDEWHLPLQVGLDGGSCVPVRCYPA